MNILKSLSPLKKLSKYIIGIGIASISTYTLLKLYLKNLELKKTIEAIS